MTELACAVRHVSRRSLAAHQKGALDTSTSRTLSYTTRQSVAEMCEAARSLPATNTPRKQHWVLEMRQLPLTSTFVVFLALLVLSADLAATSLMASRRCDSVTGTIDEMVGALNERQRRFLTFNSNLTSCAPIISRGEKCAVTLCQELMQGTRWGCYLEDSRYPFFGKHTPPKRLRGTKERAILSALDSAGALAKLSRECSRGTVNSFSACRCIQSVADQQGRQDAFAQVAEQCAYSEDSIYGPMFIAKNFVDHNEDEICHGTQTHGSDITYCMTNLHNNMVGRKIVVKSVDRRCQCIGVSGSCLHKSCIGYLPDIVNDKSIKQDFSDSFNNRAKQAYVMTSHSGVKKLVSSTTHKQLGFDELAFFKASPILCSHNKRPIGPPVGERYCNASLLDGTGSCHYLCCGGEVETVIEITEKRCNPTLVKEGTRLRYQFAKCQVETSRTKCKSRRPSNRSRRSSGATALRQ